jgi:hypothetical protein
VKNPHFNQVEFGEMWILILLFIQMLFDCGKRFVADVMLYLARIIGCGLFTYADRDKKGREYSVALIYFFCTLQTLWSENYSSV